MVKKDKSCKRSLWTPLKIWLFGTPDQTRFVIILISNSFRYPILRHLAPQFSGYNWIMDTISRTRNTLTEIISLHQRNNIREKNSYVDVYLKHIEEEEPSDQSKDLQNFNVYSCTPILIWSFYRVCNLADFNRRIT